MNKQIIHIMAITAGLVALIGFNAAAETPWDYRTVVIDGRATDARSAHSIEDPKKGHIGYHRARENAPALWLRFEGGYGDRIMLRMGVPALDQYRLLRPAIAVLGQGLPPVTEEVPFEIPEGFGGYIYHTAPLNIERYENNYHGVVSWRFEAIEHVLDHAGRVYVVGFIPVPENPEARTDYPDGKFWMTVGDKVNFRMRDLFRIYSDTRRIRAFFEDATAPSWILRNTIMGVLFSLIAAMLAVV